jgi:glyoxylate/hydroxypyruvate reductase A
MFVKSPGSILVYSKYTHDLPKFERILSSSLPGLEINFADAPERAEKYFPETTIFYGWGFPAAWLERMPKLRWVQKMGAGVDDIVGAWPADSGVVLTRTDGRLIASRMAEYVLAMILDHNLRLDHARSLQANRTWTYFEPGRLSHLTVGIAGLGEIGSEVAALLRANKCRVVGWRRSPAKSDVVDQIFVGDGKLREFVAGCDVVVLVLPLTENTRGVFRREVFSAFKPKAHLINVGRGGVVNESDLLSALDDGALARVSLDVFAQEPLSADHPFWRHPRVVLTPHVCGPLIPEDVAPHFIANVKAFLENRPLNHVVDVARQY